jgi:uncharacterized protein (DUF58 family)
MVPTDYLKRLRHVEVRSRLVSQELMSGQCDSIFKGRGMDFVDVREYTPGDDVRRIDWNVSARLRKTFIKRHVEERELTVVLLVDLSASGHFGTSGLTKRELAAELAGTLAMSAIRNNDRVGLILFTGEVEHYLPPRKTRQHVQRLLRDLLTHTPRGNGTSVSKALEFAARVTHRPALMFLLSDFHDAGYESALKSANQRHDLLAVQMIDPREQHIPDVGLAIVEDAETGEALEVDTGDPAVRAAFEQAAVQRQENLREFFRRSRIGHLEIVTDKPWANPLRTFLTLQSRRRVA